MLCWDIERYCFVRRIQDSYGKGVLETNQFVHVCPCLKAKRYSLLAHFCLKALMVLHWALHKKVTEAALFEFSKPSHVYNM